MVFNEKVLSFASLHSVYQHFGIIIFEVNPYTFINPTHWAASVVFLNDYRKGNYEPYIRRLARSILNVDRNSHKKLITITV